jgi:hypothetical protein
MTLQALNTILLACQIQVSLSGDAARAIAIENSCRANIIACVHDRELDRCRRRGILQDECVTTDADSDTVECIVGKVIHGQK